jgi:hypothetical protein
MTFSNPAGQAAVAASGYVRALLDLLGDREPISVLEGLLPWLRDRLTQVEEAKLRQPERPGKWSVIEVVQHLADSDLVMGYRIRMVLASDRPPLQGYDQDRWVSELRYREVSLASALHQMAGVREGNLALIRRMTPAHLARVGLHSERGEESVARMLQLMAGHDLVHRRQIDRILEVVGR